MRFFKKKTPVDIRKVPSADTQTQPKVEKTPVELVLSMRKSYIQMVEARRFADFKYDFENGHITAEAFLEAIEAMSTTDDDLQKVAEALYPMPKSDD